MKYEVKVPALAGDTFPLALVADAMAYRDATAGGPDILRATFEGCRTRYQAMLLKNVRSGTLTVCDDDGDPDNAADIVARRTADGCGVVVLRPGLGEIDMDATWLCNVFVKLRLLNDWAAQRGDEFTISHAGVHWVEASHCISGDGVSHFDVRRHGDVDDESLAATDTSSDVGSAVQPEHALTSPAEIGKWVTSAELLDAFPLLKAGWFDKLEGWLLEARRVQGKAGRGGYPARFCPYAVMMGLTGKIRGRRLPQDHGWHLLEQHFPDTYAQFKGKRPRTGADEE